MSGRRLLGEQDQLVRHALFAAIYCTALVTSCLGQVAVWTGQADRLRTSAYTNETLLSPSNVNKVNFGHLFGFPTDYVAQAQPLYVPNVNIPGKGVHNVVYVVTMKDSVYAFDAESNTGGNAQPLWQLNFTNPSNGITTASGDTLPCGGGWEGFTEEGIVSTPVIDVPNGTMYLVAKTVDNGTVVHRLHALDLGTGQEKLGAPVVIAATSTSNAGHVTDFRSLWQKNRPGLLLMNGVLYLGFGSNGCNGNNTGWVLSYNSSTLQQLGAFNTNPDHGLTSIWQAGGGLPGDDQGNVYALTAEGNFDLDVGGQGYPHAALKLSGPSLELTDFFVPWSVAYLNDHDLDLSGGSPVVLPDQAPPYPHVLIVVGKQGTIYVLNRENMGMYSVNDSQILQELPGVIGSMRGGPAFWNGRLYFAAKADTMKAFSVVGGLLSTAPVIQTLQGLTGAHTPSISAQGNTNGLVWVITGGHLTAYDAINLKMLYNSHQMARDALPPVGHFATQTIANGRVYIATQNSLEVYGLRHYMSVVSGGSQSGQIQSALSTPITVQAVQAYSNVPFPGVAITFSDGGKGGVFNPPSATTDNAGRASTTYTLPNKAGVYTLTAMATGFGDLNFTETATPGAPVRIVISKGNKQTGSAGTSLPIPLIAKVQDANANGVPGVAVTYDDLGKGGTFSQTPFPTDANGLTNVTYTLPTLPGAYKVKLSSPGLIGITYLETAVVGPPASMTVVSGDGQTAPTGTSLPRPLVVHVADQAGNSVAGASIAFSAPSGTFDVNPATSDATGNASVVFTTGSAPGTLTVSATLNSLSAQFTVNVTGP